MKTGFYNTDSMSLTTKKKFIQDAIKISYNVRVESKYVRGSSRTLETNITIQEAINQCYDLAVVNRSIQFEREKLGEIVFMNMHFNHPNYSYDPNHPGSGWLFLYCFMSIDNLTKLTTKYNLKSN